MRFPRFLPALTLTLTLAPALAPALALALLPGLATAQMTHDHAAMAGTGTGSGVGAGQEAVATEPGQSAFATVAEVVAILRADPATDWSKVDIAALRNHLLDMDLLMLRSTVSREKIPGGMIFTVTGADRTVGAIRGMVPSHAPYIEAETGWKVNVQLLDNGAVMRVTGDETQIRALGFYGLMTVGAHHQAHHLALARGEMPH